jgi:hypothetical protein
MKIVPYVLGSASPSPVILKDPSYMGVSAYTDTTSKGATLGLADAEVDLLADGDRVTNTCAFATMTPTAAVTMATTTV